jgi:hypothetical protein
VLRGDRNVLKAIITLQAVVIAGLLLVEVRLEAGFDRVFRAAGSAANTAGMIEDHFDTDGAVKCQ